MKKILLIGLIMVTSTVNTSCSAAEDVRQKLFAHPRTMVFATQFIATTLTVLIQSIKYLKRANNAIKSLEEQRQSDDVTEEFINTAIAALQKGKLLIWKTLGVFIGSSFTEKLISQKPSLAAVIPAIKIAVATQYLVSIKKDIDMITNELNKDDEAEDALPIDNLDNVLAVLKFGRTLAYTIAISNGVDAAGTISAPLWED